MAHSPKRAFESLMFDSQPKFIMEGKRGNKKEKVR
jgi:hypothetical protein